MVTKKNDDLAGIISEPGRGGPEVKPARSLWPRPYEDVKIEPVLGEPKAEPVRSPMEPAVSGEFETVPSEGSDEARIEPRLEPAPLTVDDIANLRVDDAPVEAAERAEPVFEAAVPPAEKIPAEAEPEHEPVHAPSSTLEEPAREANAQDGTPIEGAVENPPEGPSAEELTEAPAEAEEPHSLDRFSVLDADRPGADSRRTGGAGRFFAIAASLLLVLAVGALALVYGTALGGGTQTAEGDAAAPTTAAAGSDDLRLIRDHLDQLEQRFARIESQNASGASDNASQQLKDIAARLERLEQRADAAPAVPVPAPAPAKATSAAPASPPQTTASPPRESAAPASTASSQPTPAAAEPRTVGTVPSTQPRATETPSSSPQPRPPVTARTEPDVAPADTPTPRLGAGSPDSPVVNGWVVRDVYNGMAVLQGRRGLVEVEPGDALPDGNKVLSIRRLGGDWVVVTERGIIARR